MMCRALLVLCLCILPSCTTTDMIAFECPPVDQALASLVSKVEFPAGRGRRSGASSVNIGGNRLLTARHILPDYAFSITAGPDEEVGSGIPRLPEMLPAWVDGALVDYRVLDAGEAGDIAQDWALIEVERIDLPMPDDLTVEFDFECEVKPGEQLLLIGFPGTTEPIILPAVAVDPPSALRAPRSVLSVQTVRDRALRGMSGGPALLWHPEERHAVVVGILYGTAETSFLGITLAGVTRVVRPPLDP